MNTGSQATRRVKKGRPVIERIANTAIQHERLPMLDVVFDRSVQLLTESFLHLMSTDVRFSLTNVQYGRFGDALDSRKADPIIGVVRAREWDGTFLIILERYTMLSMVEMLLGGNPDLVPSDAPSRRLTAIETRLAMRITELIATRLSDAFSSVCKVTFEVERLEMNTQFAAIARAASAAVEAKFDLRVGSITSSVGIVFPHTSFEPVRGTLRQMFLGERLGRDEAWSTHFVSEIVQSQLTLDAVLHQELATIRGVLEWQPGMTLMFDANAETDVRLTCEKREFFRGPMGRKNGKIAVQIEQISSELDTTSDDLPNTATPKAKAQKGTNPLQRESAKGAETQQSSEEEKAA